VGGRVCALEGCDGSRYAEPGTYRNVTSAPFLLPQQNQPSLSKPRVIARCS